MPLLVLASAAVLIAASVVALWLPLRGAVERLVALLLLCQVIASGILLLLGMGLRTLEPGLIAGAAVLVAVGAAVAPGRTGRTRIRAVAARTCRDIVTQGRHTIRFGPLIALMVVVALALAWRLVLAIRLPILDWDGLNYHVVTVDVWIQSGLIGRVPQQIYSDSYPAGGELVTLWSMVFTHGDRLATLTGFFGLALAMVATIGLARRLGGDRRSAAFVGLLVAGIPAVVVSLGTTYVDLLATGDLAAAWYFGLAALRERSQRRYRGLLLLTACGVGLAVGIKVPYLPLGAVLGIALVLDALRRARAVQSVRQATIDLAIMAIPVLLLGSIWYFKNLLVFGNPIWPFQLGPFAGIWPLVPIGAYIPVELEGYGQLESIVRSWVADIWLLDYKYDTRFGGFGTAWVPLLIAAAAAVVLLFRERYLAPLIVIGVPVVITVATMPAAWWPRYTFFVAPIVLALTAVTMTRARPRVTMSFSFALVVLVAWSLTVASVTANFNMRPAGDRRPAIQGLIGLVTQPGGAHRRLGYWGDCVRFETIPAGARVATDDFVFQHLVVGHALDQILTDRVSPTGDAATLRGEAAERGARWLVLASEGRALAAALSDPASFRVVGPVCLGVHLVEVIAPPS